MGKDKKRRWHEVFYRFTRWRGWTEAGWDVNFLGVKTRTSYFGKFPPEPVDRLEDDVPYPAFDEEYFEWIDLLQAVTDAQDDFTMIELGAGWGRWMANAAAALKQVNPIPYTLVGVEAEPTHFQWIKQHLEDNGVDLSRCQLIEAAVTDEDGTVGFHTGQTPWGGPSECYGQSIGGPTPVRAISLNTILRPLTQVDLIDIDIQGAELDVLAAARQELDKKVKRVHIETHNREVEAGLRRLFGDLGWRKLNDYPCCLDYPNYLEQETEWGIIPFQGGVQTWVNPKLFSAEVLAEFDAQRVDTTLGFQLLVQPGDFTSEVILRERIYEAPESELVARLIDPGHICVDAGCHIGYYTCLFAGLAGPSGVVFGFDANPWCCRRARRNLLVNGVSSAEVVHAALGNREETVNFYLATDDQIGLSSLGPLKFNKRVVQVPMIRLEDFLTRRGVERVRLLKVDVEGAERLVLEGLGQFLEKQLIDFILIELNDDRLQLLNSSTEQVAAKLQEAGYIPWAYGADNPVGWSRTTKVESRQDCNYLFVSPKLQEEVRIPRIGLAGAVSEAREEIRALKEVVEARQQAPTVSEARTILTTPAQAVWNQRHRLAPLRPRISALSAAVNQPTDLTQYQWLQLMAFTLDFSPDLIIELGRGMGNSTCCFLEAASQLGGASACRLISLCLSNSWFTTTMPRLRTLVTPEWLAPAELLQVNIRDYDFVPAIGRAQRILVFWDAHGFEVAESVLSRLLPLLADKPHRVAMHDMSDIRYEIPSREYGDVGIWKGTNASDPAFWLGNVFSRVAQAISIIDFTTRNKIPLHSAVESFHEEFMTDPPRLNTVQKILGEDFITQSHWFWFSLEEAGEKLIFPPFTGISLEEEQARAASEAQLKEREHDIEWLMQNLRDTEEQNRRLRAEHQEWEDRWVDLHNSAGWRFVEGWRRWKDRLAPEGSTRRSLYDSALKKYRQ